MMKNSLLLVVGLFALASSGAEAIHAESYRAPKESLTFKADQVAVDHVTKAARATGHVEAKVGVLTLRGESLERDAAGRVSLSRETCVTTCTNDVGETHWNVTGEVEYAPGDHVVVRDAWLHFYEIPVFYLPYLYYPLDTACGFAWMPGYVGGWGAFLLTRYNYHLLGDDNHGEDTWWLKGGTDFDMRTKRGLALGERLEWNLGNLGTGKLRAYYAWDKDVSDDDSSGRTHDANWGSTIPDQRYGFTFEHRWEATERDHVVVRAMRYSDSDFRRDFIRKGFFEIRNQWATYENSAVIWEHNESAWSFGVEASGRLNDFYAAMERLPEIYLDLNPTPVFSTPFVYETQNRAGWLDRRFAEYGSGRRSVFGTNPGLWCDYEAFRLDTYHRLSAPFRTAGDVLSVVPRLGYRGTYWSESGESNYSGEGAAKSADAMYRSVFEGGVTFAARGTGWVGDSLAHTVEPYLDLLVQEVCYAGRDGDNRPYVFDSLDASLAWEDQFAGRARNLPYSYYGLTPGFRQSWSTPDEKGNLETLLDLDVYAALSFGATDFDGDSRFNDYDAHKLAELGRKNYGTRDAYVSPGVRLRWTPDDDMRLQARAEYDSDRNRVSFGDLAWSHRLSDTFTYDFTYALRDMRYWDFSSSPQRRPDGEDYFNFLMIHTARAGLTYQPVDWFAFSPYVRWDLDENELDSVGAWFDYLTDCLGFRFLVEYENDCKRVDGYTYDDEWNFGFYIYLRAFGSQAGSPFMAH